MEPTTDTRQFPYELLGPIFEQLEGEKTLLCVVSLASSSFREEAQRILFRNVTDLKMYTSHVKFLRTVAVSPTRLALFVHTYTQRLFDSSDEELAEAALKAMRNLKCLDVYPTYPFYGPYMPMRILCGCAFDLERFDATADYRDGNDIIEKFLPGQHGLKHLGIAGSGRIIHALRDPQLPFIAKSCLQLVSLKGSWDMIKAILPGRKITTLSISEFNIEIDAATIKSLAVEFKHVKALSLSAYNMCNLGMQDGSFQQHFPSLKMLELTYLSMDKDLYLHSLHNSPSFFEMISSLPELHTLILTGTDDTRRDFKMEHLQFICHLCEILGKNLKYIDVQANGDIYTRYTENSISTEISEAEARKVWLAEPRA